MRQSILAAVIAASLTAIAARAQFSATFQLPRDFRSVEVREVEGTDGCYVLLGRNFAQLACK